MALTYLEIVSRVFGWLYTICWSLSFYPQPVVNYRRRSTSGTTIDFPAINTLGFFCYLIFNVAFLYSPHIRKEYSLRHPGFVPAVQLNDVAFAAHAVILSAITVSQFLPSLWGFERTRARGGRVSKGIQAVFLGSFVVIGVVASIVSEKHDDHPTKGWGWIDVVYTISYVKLFITLIKYFPQLITNYRNRSTQGWSIAQILLDFAGGVLSISQLCLDSYLQGDWSGITGNPVKLALGNVSIFFDIMFVIQHYILYAGKDHKGIREDEEDPLIGQSNRARRVD